MDEQSKRKKTATWRTYIDDETQEPSSVLMNDLFERFMRAKELGRLRGEQNFNLCKSFERSGVIIESRDRRNLL